MNDPNVTHETKNNRADRDVLFEYDWRRDEKNESTKRVQKTNFRRNRKSRSLCWHNIISFIDLSLLLLLGQWIYVLFHSVSAPAGGPGYSVLCKADKISLTA